MLKPWLANKIIYLRNSRNYSLEELEKRQFENHTSHFQDSIFFAGIDPKGINIVTRMFFHSDKSDGNWLKLYLPDVGIIGFENMPFRSSDSLRQGPMIYHCKEPGKEWHIIYNGPINNIDKDEIEIDLHWKSDPFILDFSTEGVKYKDLAQHISSLFWNRDVYNDIKGLGKVHYEQPGRITGIIRYKDVSYDVDLTAIRDHSFGVRRWEHWNRHLWFIGILDDGRFFSLSSVNYRDIEDLNSGFIGDGKKTRTTLWQTPSINQVIEEPSLPSKVFFDIKEKKNGPVIHCNAVMKHFFPFNLDNTYHIRQAVARFEFGSLRGTGIAELGINTQLYPDIVVKESLGKEVYIS